MLNPNLAKENSVLIVDWDNVLQYIDYEWLKLLFASKNQILDRAVSKILEELDPPTPKELLKSVVNRDNYYIEEFLISKFNLHETLNSRELDEFSQEWYNLYLNDENFYDKLSTTKIYTALSLMLVAPKLIGRLYILTHVNKDDPRKSKVFKELFDENDPRIQLVQLDMSIPKHEWIVDNVPEFDMLIDDRIDIIEDTFLSFSDEERKKKEFMCPSYGYNKVAIKHLSNIHKDIILSSGNILHFDQDTLEDI